ncbi:hypothetical protein A943_19030 [Bacillus sp. CPSM8]|nr:hypothetical protein A943_19030 [Bacillus sp. CPSM8]PLC17176.1 hypothetical protein BV582_06450 [Bacillus paralicheniformis]QSF99017.1 hypothetical protein DI291_11605 [Bacillus paralicheniformis]
MSHCLALHYTMKRRKNLTQQESAAEFDSLVIRLQPKKQITSIPQHQLPLQIKLENESRNAGLFIFT